MVQKVSYRQEVIPVKTSVWVPQEYEQTVRRSYYVPLPRVVEREVAQWIWVPTVAFDPCTCCCVVSWCPQLTTTRVHCVEYDYRLDERVETVRMCRWVQQETVVNQVRHSGGDAGTELDGAALLRDGAIPGLRLRAELVRMVIASQRGFYRVRFRNHGAHRGHGENGNYKNSQEPK